MEISTRATATCAKDVDQMTEHVIDPERYANITLEDGGHQPGGGLCLMEAAAFLVGEQHTDHPLCVCPTLGAFGRALNDTLPGDKRQELKAFIPSLVGTANDGQDLVRGWMALDWFENTWWPTWRKLTDDIPNDAGPFFMRFRERVSRTLDSSGYACVQPTINFSIAKFGYHEDTPSSFAHAVVRCVGDKLDRKFRLDPEGFATFVQPVVDELQDSMINLFAEMIKNPRMPSPTR